MSEVSVQSTILAFDSVGKNPCCALRYKDQIFSQELLNGSSQTLSADLVSTMQSLLSQAGIQFKDIHVLSALVGPGSFTGIRMGLATVQGISMATSCSLFTPTTLDLLCYFGWKKTKLPILAAIDTQRDDFYVQETDSLFEIKKSPSFMTVDEIKEISQNVLIVSNVPMDTENFLLFKENTAQEMISFYDFSLTFSRRALSAPAVPFYLRTPSFVKQKRFQDKE